MSIEGEWPLAGDPPCCADQIFEVAEPVSAWGTEVFLVGLEGRPSGSLYRVVASADNTAVKLDGAAWETLNKGEFVEIISAGDHRVTADRPILAVQYQMGTEFEILNTAGPNGDPAMVNLMPVSQFQTEYTFSALETFTDYGPIQPVPDPNGVPQFSMNYAMIVANCLEAKLGQIQIILNGESIDYDADFNPLPGGEYCYARVYLNTVVPPALPNALDTFTTSSPTPHGLVVHGYDNEDSYLYPGGAILRRDRLDDCNNNNVLDECEVTTMEARFYVDDDAHPGEAGTTWEKAFPTLQEALSAASMSCAYPIEIWVAQGSKYYADTLGGGRDATFQLINGVSVLGGFQGLYGEPGSDPDERNIEKFPSILNGDIGTFGDPSDNTRHIVTGSGTDASAILDGFTIMNGNAEGEGAGILIEYGSPTISNCRIQNNWAGSNGAGMFCYYSAPAVVNCIFTANSATYGSGMANWDATSTVVNCVFHQNGGIAIYNKENAPVFSNCTIVDNLAGGHRAAGILNDSSAPVLSNCIVWGNLAYSYPDPADIQNAQIYHWGTPTATVTYSCIQDDLAGDGNAYPDGGPSNTNIDLDPTFQGPVGDYHLTRGSPCIDAGDNDAVQPDLADLDADSDVFELTPHDLDSSKRFVDDPHSDDTGSGDAPIVDMGAYEFLAPGLHSSGSRQNHGAGGDYLVLADAIECRKIDGIMTLVFEHDVPVYSADGDGFVASDFTVINAVVDSVVQSPDLTTIEVKCTGITDASCISIAFTVENDVGNEASREFTWQVLEGDVNGDGLVDKADQDVVKAQDGQTPAGDTCRCDVNMNGLIEGAVAPLGADLAIVLAAENNAVADCWPKLSGMVSRKYHGTTFFDVAVGEVEPRTGDVRLVFTFDREMRSLDDDLLAAGDFTITSGTILSVKPGANWSEIIVDITGVTDKAVFTISFDAEDADDFPVSVEGCWRMLIGDADGSGAVDAADVVAVENSHGKKLDKTNFLTDLDLSGKIEGLAPDAADSDIAESNNGHAVGACGA